ncbi:hypothetical protein [Peribacillus frigoritolerans]|uniref:hypothetical protein n=1 Tax=Peribacillus frigoritolerans TaxID=450367 RepID=UPI002079C89D|nr:hypothetical protein [Peribacillus frigoritolerans]USK66290.1 hypothetical protein LIT26_06575 [Peribacillus frigoritolerans]
MKELAELKRIVDGQKTVSTNRLKPLLDTINKSYVESGQKIKRQSEEINRQQGLYDKRMNKIIRQHNIELAKQKHIASQLALRLSASMMKNDGTL